MPKKKQKPTINEEITKEDIKIIKSFTNYLEGIQFQKYIENHTHLRKVVLFNILAGVARGFGYIIGATILIAYFWFILDWLGGLPFIGKIVVDILEIVNSYQK